MQSYKIKIIEDLLADRHNPLVIEQKIIDRIVALWRNPNYEVGYGTRRGYLAVLLTFYDINDVILWEKISWCLGEQVKRARVSAVAESMQNYAEGKVITSILYSTSAEYFYEKIYKW